MIDYGSFQFASAPRTGTTWFTKTLQSVGLPRAFKAHIHTPFESPRKYRVSLLRHPCSWLTSYWVEVHGANLGLPPLEPFRNLPTDDFDHFVSSYLEKSPGAVGRLFEWYRADTYLKLESFPKGMVTFLRCLGFSHREARKALTVHPVNMATGDLPEWCPHLKQAVIEAEASFLDRYEFW